MQSARRILTAVAVISAVGTTVLGGTLPTKRTKCYVRTTMENRRTDNLHQVTGKPLPKSVDWRDKNVVTPVKDQGGCGSCYAFAATGAMESAHALKTGKLISLSEQQIIDCDVNQTDELLLGVETDGCNGGLPETVFFFAVATAGMESEAEFQYRAEDGKCPYNVTRGTPKEKIAARFVDYVNIQSFDELALQDAVAHIGPVAVGIDCGPIYITPPGDSIVDSPSCKQTHTGLNHGVLVVGYNEEGDEPYWIIKNSWSSSWNNGGYFKMAMHKNMCGIATDASYPIAA